jgi:hypothetical protein
MRGLYSRQIYGLPSPENAYPTSYSLSLFHADEFADILMETTVQAITIVGLIGGVRVRTLT